MHGLTLLPKPSLCLIDDYNQPVRSTKYLSKLSWPILIALALNIALSLSYIGLWFIAGRDQLFWQADFSAFFTAGAIVRDGLGSQIYDLDLQTNYQQALLHGNCYSKGIFPYNYPSHFAIIFGPLNKLSLAQAYYVWTALQLLLLVALVILLAHLFKEYLRKHNLPRSLFAIIALSYPFLFLLDEFYLSAWLPIRLAIVAMIIMLIWSGILLHQENLSL